ncbi:hypothetical protein ACFPYN_05510 [Paenisporosarcina macmurdoensis]|uniref:ABC transporter permease n=1 Tax=Paenisporosarcina macmurdoensis TaxID=212659 RepID=A0ABW1L5N6_9BACL
MNKYWFLVSNVYKDKIKSKSILVSTIIFMMLLSVLIFWSDIQDKFLSEEQVKIAILDNSGEDANRYITSNEIIAFENTNKNLEKVDADIKSEKYLAAIVLTLNKNGVLESELRTMV